MRLVVCVAGTFAGNAAWCEDPSHPFQRALTAAGLVNFRHPSNNLPFRWSTRLAGLPFMSKREWYQAADELIEFIEPLLDYDLNFIGHSHGGQPVIIAADKLRGKRKFRTFTSVATPRRHDLPAESAATNITYWQHLLDQTRDLTATLRTHLPRAMGGVGDGEIDLERRFLIPGVINIGIPEVGHSALMNAEGVHWWKDAGFFDPINAPQFGDPI